jgi:antitoxin ParD1/3/4
MPGYGLIDRMVRALQQRRREDALRLKVLRAQIAAGADELERGDFVEVDAQDLEAYLQRLTAGATTDLR